MNSKDGQVISRRQFARRAALLSASVTVVPAEAFLPATSSALTQQSSTQLSPESQLEADSRYQQVLSLYGNRLDDTQKANIKKMCTDLQPMLERIRKFDLQNGNSPALYLKPLVEREKKSPPATPTSKKP
jgi:hypothetical protein